MDKETLSNYGWIVILVLILAVMLALATPFGNFIAGAIKSTTAGFFSVNQNAMNAVGIIIPGQDFKDKITEDEIQTGYKYMDSVQIGDYMYFYCICDSYEEYATGYLRFGLFEDAGIVCESDDDALVKAAELFLGVNKSLEELQAEGVTLLEIAKEIGLTEEVYEYAKIEGSILFDGWWVRVVDKTKSSYGEILSEIDGVPVMSINSTFFYCENMTVAPEIPETIVDMYAAFEHSSLTVAPVIPQSITSIAHAFSFCHALTGEIQVPCRFIGLTPPDYNIAQDCSATITYYHIDGCDGSCSK